MKISLKNKITILCQKEDYKDIFQHFEIILLFVASVALFVYAKYLESQSQKEFLENIVHYHRFFGGN